MKGQIISPYTPNLYYYSKNWKNQRPLRYPVMEYFNHTGIMGIYNFCEITESLGKVDPQKFEEMIEQAKKKVEVGELNSRP